jgi:ectoine hydroxylase-related dioxygenase (phytanoyl-CoA dioxygenase family)
MTIATTMTPVADERFHQQMTGISKRPATAFQHFDANDPATTTATVVDAINHAGGAVISNLMSAELAAQIKSDLAPSFATSHTDTSQFFPSTTERATALFNHPSYIQLATNPLWISIANALVSSTYTYFRENGRTETVTEKPIISSTVGFRVLPGGKQQVLHRDDNDYHPYPSTLPVMIGCVAALTKTTAANGATVAIPGSHLWPSDRFPKNEEAIPAELNPGDAFIFLGNLYHGGGANVTEDEYRETVGVFMCKPTLRPAENQFLSVPLETVKEMTPQAQRLLGYGVARPGVGFVRYKDPMKEVLGVEDDEVVEL